MTVWILDCVYCRTEVWNIKWQIAGTFFILMEFKGCVLYNNFQIYLNNLGWIRIRNSENSKLDPDPEKFIPDPQHCMKKQLK